MNKWQIKILIFKLIKNLYQIFKFKIQGNDLSFYNYYEINKLNQKYFCILN